MTAQIPDSLLWNEVEHDLVAIDDVWPFAPWEHGLAPVSPHTACWRGYVAKYAIATEGLVLHTLRIGTGDAAAPAWRGIQPSRDESDDMWRYANVALPVPYSGGLVIGTGFRSELYVHFGSQPAYAYERVLELSLNDGRVASVADRSAGMARIRGIIEQAGALSPDLLERLMARVFSASYDVPFY